MSARPRGCDGAKVIQVVETRARGGEGNDMSDPCRLVTQYWSFEGEKLAERDEWATERDAELALRKIREAD